MRVSSTAVSGGDRPAQWHAFISYVREDADKVEMLQRALQDAGIPVWRDEDRLQPGVDWRATIRRAIEEGSLAFIACFSRHSAGREATYQYEELTLAFGQLRQRRLGDQWFIPVRFDDCAIPDLEIGGGRTLSSIQQVDLFGHRAGEEIARLVEVVRQLQERHSATTSAAPGEPYALVRQDGLYVWTAANSQAGLEPSADLGDVEPIEPGQLVDVTALMLGQLPNLQREFRRLGTEFDTWLASGPSRKRGRERLRVLWLVGEAGPQRSKALLACLARARQQDRAVYDASRNLSLAASTVSRSILAAGFVLPPLISVDLKEEQWASPWSTVETAVTNAGKYYAGRPGPDLRGDDPYPRMIVAGTMEQEAAAAKLLYGLADITAVDRGGMPTSEERQKPEALERRKLHQLKVFLCHGSEDKSAVRSLYAQLRAADLNPWLDEIDIAPGMEWDTAVRTAIHAADIVLACLSSTSVKKTGYVQKEIRFALDRADEKPEGTTYIIPVKLEECEVPSRLSRWQWVNLFEEQGYERLMSALREHARRLLSK